MGRLRLRSRASIGGESGSLLDAVTDLTATVNVDRTITLDWTDAAVDPGGYKVYRTELDQNGAAVGSETLLDSVSSGVETFDDPFSDVDPSAVIVPSGAVLLSAREWNTLAANQTDSANSEGWNPAGEGQSSNVSIVTDATAPISPSNVFRTTYPSGFAGGSSPVFPGPGYDAGFSTAYRGLYYRGRIKPSAAFQGHTENITKLGFLWCGEGGAGTGSNDFYMKLSGVGTVNPLLFSLNTQNRQGGARHWDRTLGSSGDDEIVRGEWNTIEVYIQFETSVGAGNGIVRAAVNGTQIIEVTNENFRKTGEDDLAWTRFKLDRTWGGSGDTTTDEFYLDEDHSVLMGVL